MVKTVVVCGAGPAWGYQIAKKFAQEGYQVALISRTQSKLEELSAKLQSEVPKSANKVKIFTADLTIPENVKRVSSEVLSSFGSIDVLYSGIAPAEQFQFVPASELTHENALSNLSIYFLSAVSTVQAFLPSLLSQKSGSIVLGAAITAKISFPFKSGPGPAMAALRQYSLTLHHELKEKNIFVGIVMVGGVIIGSELEDKVLKTNIPRNGLPSLDATKMGDLVWDIIEKKEPEVCFPPSLQ